MRAILFDDRDQLVLIRRTKPGCPPYWTTSGGGVEPEDASREATLERELMEELGARIVVGPQVFLVGMPYGDVMDVQHYHVCREISVDPALRNGPEHSDPSRGGYELARIRPDRLATIDLRPTELSTYITANIVALLAEAPPIGRPA